MSQVLSRITYIVRETYKSGNSNYFNSHYLRLCTYVDGVNT